MAYQILEKTIRDADLPKCNIPKAWLRSWLLPGDHKPGSKTGIRVFNDLLSKEFTFILKIRPFNLEKQRYDEKPEFIGKDWAEFVRKSKLQPGEKICFYQDPMKGHNKVHVEKNFMA